MTYVTLDIFEKFLRVTGIQDKDEYAELYRRKLIPTNLLPRVPSRYYRRNKPNNRLYPQIIKRFKKKYGREYNFKKDRKLYRRLYTSTPEYKAGRKLNRQLPKNKAWVKAYHQQPETREMYKRIANAYVKKNKPELQAKAKAVVDERHL